MIGNGRPHPSQAHELAQTATGCLPSSPKERGRKVEVLKARPHTNNIIQERGGRDEWGKTSPPAPPLGKGRGART